MTTTSSSFNLSVGQKIKQKRLEHKLTQSQLANKCKITFQQIQKYEKGTNGCSAFRIYQLADHLKVNVVYFFEYPKEVENQND
jgi:transcriptional regulator with XRE-family HTH domain